MTGPSPSASSDAVATLPRAVAIRACLIYGPLALLIVIAANVSGDMPVAQVVASFGTVATIALIVSIWTDRKLRVDLGKPDAPWNGAYAAWIPVDADVTPEEAIRMSRRAVASVRAHDVRILGNHTAVGWVGSIWTNVPRWQAYQLAVVVLAQPGGPTRLVCCARPRMSSAWVGGAMSQEWAGRLQRAVNAQR